MILFSVCCASEYANASGKSMPDFCANATSVSRETFRVFERSCVVFHMEHIEGL